MGFYTITWEDIYDYLRCPKIVSFKEMGIKLWRIPKRRRPKAKPTTIGELGEEMVRAVLPSLSASPKALDAGAGVREVEPEKFVDLVRLIPSLKKRVEKVSQEVLGKPLADAGPYLQNMVKRDLVGLFKIASRLSTEFGELKLVGKGGLRSIMQPSTSAPDAVFSTGRGRLLVAEVKNVERSVRGDRFQATYYNTTAKLGALVLGKRMDNGVVKLLPETFPEEKISTVLLYPRQGEMEKINKVIELRRILKDVWRVKQLGLMGKQPESPKIDYCKRCVWKRVCSNWSREGPPIDEHEPATPMPLIIAKGLIETGYDIETQVLYDLVRDEISGIYMFIKEQIDKRHDRLLDIRLNLYDTAVRLRGEPTALLSIAKLDRIIHETRMKLRILEGEKFVEQVASALGLSHRRASALLHPWYLPSQKTSLYRKVLRDMSSELQPWKRILKKKSAEYQRLLRELYVTQFIPPARSRYLINKAWRFWH